MIIRMVQTVIKRDKPNNSCCQLTEAMLCLLGPQVI